MFRRDFLAAAAAGLPVRGQEAESRRRAPFQLLYSNDTTNLYMGSPYHKRGEPITSAVIEGSVDEAAGVDVHLLQPGYCWVPWWKSASCPVEKHYRWVRQEHGRGPDAIGEYLLNGGDLIGTFVRRCRAKGQAPFISFRLNDHHYLDEVGTGKPRAVYVSRFYEEHPEYRLGTDATKGSQRVHNWAIPEVREYKFRFLREICDHYDIDGLELDFQRFPSYFRQNETTSSQRARIMTGFVAAVRQLLDVTSRPGRHRWLCARVPPYVARFDALGLDLPGLAAAGLEMINISSFYYTNAQCDVLKIRRQAPHAAVYLEMTHATWWPPPVAEGNPVLKTTDEQFYTAANLAYSRGADGLSFFNFVYYRPRHEPPFHVIARLRDRQWLSRQPQWNMLARDMFSPQLPRTFNPGQAHRFTLDLAPAGRRDGLLRVRFVEPTDGHWGARMNGTALQPTPFVEKPFPHPYDEVLGTAANHACFRIPHHLLRDGANELEVTLRSGQTATVEYLDLALP
jgi:hypothetical protein